MGIFAITIPPKYPVAKVIGFLKGKSAIAIARLSGKERSFSDEHLGAGDKASQRATPKPTRQPLLRRPN
jgi:hypothetical protein